MSRTSRLAETTSPPVKTVPPQVQTAPTTTTNQSTYSLTFSLTKVHHFPTNNPIRPPTVWTPPTDEVQIGATLDPRPKGRRGSETKTKRKYLTPVIIPDEYFYINPSFTLPNHFVIAEVVLSTQNLSRV